MVLAHGESAEYLHSVGTLSPYQDSLRRLRLGENQQIITPHTKQ